MFEPLKVFYFETFVAFMALHKSARSCDVYLSDSNDTKTVSNVDGKDCSVGGGGGVELEGAILSFTFSAVFLVSATLK